MEGFTNTLCFGALLIGAIILLFFVMRWLRSQREAPAGTYDSPDFDSGGSIGGMRGGRAYDSPDFDSGATIGGDTERQAYDSSEIRSGGSIGGGPRVEEREETGRVSERPRISREQERRAYDRPEIESGGSIGGGPRVQEKPAPSAPQPERATGVPGRARTVSDGWEVEDVGMATPPEPEAQPEKETPRQPYRTRKTGGRTDSPDIESGGSFGG